MGILFIGILIIVAMMFFSGRSQKKRDQEVQSMRDNLQVGDEVTTIGGIIGKVVAIKDETFVLETTKEKTHMRFLKASIRSVDVKVAGYAVAQEPEAPKSLGEKFAALPTSKKVLIIVGAVLLVAALVVGGIFLSKKDPVDPGDYSVGLAFTTNGDGTCSVSGLGTCEDTVIKIPTTSPAGDSVVEIKIGAFKESKTITAVVIPESVTTIGDYAFYGCVALESVTIGENVQTIGEQAFFCCSKLAEVKFPANVTSIGYGAFAYCNSLTEVVIPTNVTSIGSSAFYGCELLKKVDIQSGIKTINALTFAECTIEELYLHTNIRAIDASAFTNIESTKVFYTGLETEWNLIPGNEIFNFENVTCEYKLDNEKK